MNLMPSSGLSRVGTVLTKTYGVLILAVLAQATGNVFLSKGMKVIGSANPIGEGGVVSIAFQAVASPMIWMGVVLSIIFYILFATALSWSDLSFVLPVISFEVVLNVAFGAWFLSEGVSSKRWIGTLLIAIGIFLVLRSEGPMVETGGGGKGILEDPGR